MAFHVEEKNTAEQDAVNVGQSRNIPPGLVSVEDAAWRDIAQSGEVVDGSIKELISSMVRKLPHAVNTALELGYSDDPEISKYGSIHGAYALVARSELATDYAFSRLMRALIEHIVQDDHCYIDESQEAHQGGGPIVVVSRRTFEQLVPDDDCIRKIGEWWLRNDDDSLLVRSMHPTSPTDALLRQLSEWYGCNREQALRMLNPLGSVSLRAFASAAFIDTHK